MKKLAIIGAGDLGQQLAWHVSSERKYEVVGYFDDIATEPINGIEILGKISDIVSCSHTNKFDDVLIAIGYKHLQFKSSLYSYLKGKVNFGKFIHSSCWVDGSSIIGEGVIIFPRCIIDQNVTIRENVVINVGGCVCHDTIIREHTFLSPRVAIAGFCDIGSCSVIGINSSIIDNIKIVSNTIVGGGAVVKEDIGKNGLYVGNPVRFVR